MTDKPKLLPCPFCGGSNLTIGESDCRGIAVSCGGSNVDVDGELTEVCGFQGPDVPSLDGDAAAIAAWNRRADLAPDFDDAVIELLCEANRLASHDTFEALARRILTEAKGGNDD